MKAPYGCGNAVLNYSDAVIAVNPPTARDISTVPEMVRNLNDDYHHAARSVRAAMDVACAVDEASTVQLMALHIAAHRKWRRKLTLVAEDV